MGKICGSPGCSFVTLKKPKGNESHNWGLWQTEGSQNMWPWHYEALSPASEMGTEWPNWRSLLCVDPCPPAAARHRSFMAWPGQGWWRSQGRGLEAGHWLPGDVETGLQWNVILFLTSSSVHAHRSAQHSRHTLAWVPLSNESPPLSVFHFTSLHKGAVERETKPSSLLKACKHRN